MQIGKLYSYYLGKLFRKNWLKMVLFLLVSVLMPGFLTRYGFFYASNRKVSVEKVEGEVKSFKEVNQFGLTEKVKIKDLKGEEGNWKRWREEMLEEIKEENEEGKKAKESGDEKKIEEIENKLRYRESTLALIDLIVPPSLPGSLDLNDLFIKAKGTSEGKNFGKMINNISFGALGTGFLFTWLTLQVVDFLFLRPKKDGEEREVLTYLPGATRNQLLVSKILTFLTYYGLLAMVGLILPCLFYYSGAGAVAPFSDFAGLFLYCLTAGVLLTSALLIIPYVLLNSYSSVWGSFFSGSFYLGHGGIFIGKATRTSLIPYRITNGLSDPYIFTPLAVLVGLVCFSFYYGKTQSEDLGT